MSHSLVQTVDHSAIAMPKESCKSAKKQLDFAEAFQDSFSIQEARNAFETEVDGICIEAMRVSKLFSDLGDHTQNLSSNSKRVTFEPISCPEPASLIPQLKEPQVDSWKENVDLDDWDYFLCYDEEPA